MAKYLDDAVLDAALDKLATADQEILCAGQPANYTAATTTNKLASVAIDGTDFTKANGDVSGRKITVAQQTGVSITATGNADHAVLVDDALTLILAITTCTSQAVTSGNTATINAWKLEVADVA